MTPVDIETHYHMPGGHWHHGELQVDQLLVNPPGHAVAGYETPIVGLYLASAGAHPGGGISGLPGLLPHGIFSGEASHATATSDTRASALQPAIRTPRLETPFHPRIAALNEH